MKERVLLGDEAVALAAVHAGISSAYAYPGTPSTEVLEFLIANYKKHGKPYATWCANEKTSLECALGASMTGKRSLVAMKHVGLNVAADPFMNAALVKIGGGLVIAVADDPGMHSSQNEQDTRIFSDFAKVICLEPASGQEAYDMTVQSFEISEKFNVPVVIRLVTRVAHSRSLVKLGEIRKENSSKKIENNRDWILLPSNARRQWQVLMDLQGDFESFIENSSYTRLNPGPNELGVITTGSAYNYFMENWEDLNPKPAHLHIGAYPFPKAKIREISSKVKRLLIIEEGAPYLETHLVGILGPLRSGEGEVEIQGKLSGNLPLTGELNSDLVRSALKLERRPTASTLDYLDYKAPGRPPQLCKGCPHIDTFKALKNALGGLPEHLVTSDIGCYTLGALPPYNAIDSCVCMGASVGMAKGVADSGYHPVVAILGDSTFLHSGITPLLDAVKADANMTLVIVDNLTVAMTGGQETLVNSEALQKIVMGLGVRPEHLKVINAHPKFEEENTGIFKGEIAHQGLSVIIAVRECIQTLKRNPR